MDLAPGHELDDLLGHVGAHAVVRAGNRKSAVGSRKSQVKIYFNGLAFGVVKIGPRRALLQGF